MANTPDIKQHYGLYGGMDSSSESHLLSEQQWRQQFNVRSTPALKQLEKLVLLWGIQNGEGGTKVLANLPNGRSDYGLWLMGTHTNMYTFKETGPFTHLHTLVSDTARLSYEVYNGRLFATSPLNPVFYIDAIHGTAQQVYARRGCWTKENGEELLGSGAFTLEPLYDGEEPIGDLGKEFTWTEDETYRVYVQRPKLFVTYSTVSIRVVRSDKTVLTLVGTVLERASDYIVVKASATVAGLVPNSSSEAGDTFFPARVTVSWMPVPSGRYVKVFFDHLVIGSPKMNGVWRPSAISWSHLYDFANFVPGTDSEADSYDFTEYQRSDDIVLGVSGMAHMGEQLLIFTPSSVHAMSYTGLPRVVRVAPVLRDVGCGLPYTVAELNNSVAWCDIHHGAFFMMRGQELKNIGATVSDEFFSELSTDRTWLTNTWCFVDRMEGEATWVYRKDSLGGYFNRAIVFNYLTETWYRRSIDNVYSFARLGRRAKTISELTGKIDLQSGVIDDLGNTTVDVGRIWGRETGMAMRGEVSTDLDATLLSQEQPVLETGDLLYGSAQQMKTVSAITINATGTTFNGVQVEVSARERIDDTVTYTVVGTWTTSLAQRMLTFAPMAGKVLRYRFKPVLPVRGFVFRGYEDNVSNTGAHR